MKVTEGRRKRGGCLSVSLHSRRKDPFALSVAKALACRREEETVRETERWSERHRERQRERHRETERERERQRESGGSPELNFGSFIKLKLSQLTVGSLVTLGGQAGRR
jgi:hypothetical protein